MSTQPNFRDFFSANNRLASSDRMAFVVKMMRDVSRQTDPQELVRIYGQYMRQLISNDGFVSLSRRDLQRPMVRITRSSSWKDPVNPWRDKDRLPLLDGGLLSDLIWGDVPAILDEVHVSEDDPAYEYLKDMKSLVALPLYDGGEALNMVVQLNKKPGAYNSENLPEHVWLSNMFGRATTNLVLAGEVKRAYETVDAELKVVEDIQKSLLPTELPEIATLDMAVFYQTSRRAGGDYYDFFELPGGKWGILIADVSGHGTPAAVIMAVTHSIAHALAGPPQPPSRLLGFLNQELYARYTGGKGTFVTAFYGIYDPATKSITYASAGHCPPRIRRAHNGILNSLDQSMQLPLGILPDETFADCTCELFPGDTVALYTDGITEARGADTDLFGVSRLDEVLLSCDCPAKVVAKLVIAAVEKFTNNLPAADDRTLLVAKVS